MGNKGGFKKKGSSNSKALQKELRRNGPANNRLQDILERVAKKEKKADA